MTTSADPRDLLRARAAALARPVVPDAGPADEILCVKFRIQGETFGFMLEEVRGVEPCPSPTPVPCTPPWVLGIINVRGEILTVVDLARYLDLSGLPTEPRTRALVVSALGVTVCVIVDEILGADALDRARLGPALPNSGRFRPEYVRGITDAGVTLLNAERLLGDPSFSVNDPVDA